MEIIKVLWDSLLSAISKHPKSSLITSILLLLLAVATVVLTATSCSYLPKVSENNLGAEGAVSKEKNVNRQTKWYFQPDQPYGSSDSL